MTHIISSPSVTVPHYISHRGLRESGAVENSRMAFELARDRGFQILETDLRATNDGHIVLSHDGDLTRIAGCAKVIADMSRAQISSLQLKDGQKILFLDDFLQIFTQQRWVFDIKEETATQVIEALDKLWQGPERPFFEEKTMFLAWSYYHQCLIQQAFPQAKTLARESECWRAGLAALLGAGWGAGIKPGRIYALPPQWAGQTLYTKKIAETFHQRGAHLLAYLPTQPSEIKQACALGFDFILSDGLIL